LTVFNEILLGALLLKGNSVFFLPLECYESCTDSVHIKHSLIMTEAQYF